MLKKTNALASCKLDIMVIILSKPVSEKGYLIRNCGRQMIKCRPNRCNCEW